MSTCCGSNETLEFLLKCINKNFCSLLDSEIALMCDGDGNPVFARLRFTTQLDTSTTVLVDAWNLDGSKYSGTITDLVACGGGGGGGDVNLISVGGTDFTLGQKTMPDSLPVVLASDQDPIDVTETNVSTVANFHYGSLAFGAVSGAYATLVTNSDNAKVLDVYNGLDQDVILSFNATNSHIYVPKSTGKVIGLESNKLFVSTNLSVKSVAAVSSGSVVGTLIY